MLERPCLHTPICCCVDFNLNRIRQQFGRVGISFQRSPDAPNLLTSRNADAVVQILGEEKDLLRQITLIFKPQVLSIQRQRALVEAILCSTGHSPPLAESLASACVGAISEQTPFGLHSGEIDLTVEHLENGVIFLNAS